MARRQPRLRRRQHLDRRPRGRPERQPGSKTAYCGAPYDGYTNRHRYPHACHECVALSLRAWPSVTTAARRLRHTAPPLSTGPGVAPPIRHWGRLHIYIYGRAQDMPEPARYDQERRRHRPTAPGMTTRPLDTKDRDVMTTIETVAAHTLITPDLYNRSTRRVINDTDTDRDFAERIVDQAIAFLAACANHPEQQLAPSPTVDHGWHAFLLYTREYAAFCQQQAGHFIHHIPHDQPGAPQHPTEPMTIRDATVDAIRRAGYTVDPELWEVDNDKCGPCHEEGNCGASGKDGNENTDKRTPPRTRR